MSLSTSSWAAGLAIGLVGLAVVAIRGSQVLQVVYIWMRRAKWVDVFEGSYHDAKTIIAKLNAAHIPYELTFQPEAGEGSSTVVLQVLSKTEREARLLISRSD